jgi:hypothetical protein
MMGRREKSSSCVLDPGDRESSDWMLYELDYVWREAQAEADLAYLDWCRYPGSEGYVVYRAAQDRADTAQDELAGWARVEHATA